jgi:hypothetical protein
MTEARHRRLARLARLARSAARGSERAFGTAIADAADCACRLRQVEGLILAAAPRPGASAADLARAAQLRALLQPLAVEAGRRLLSAVARRVAAEARLAETRSRAAHLAEEVEEARRAAGLAAARREEQDRPARRRPMGLVGAAR